MIPEIQIGWGVFETPEEACEAAFAAQKDYVENFTTSDRARFIANVRKKLLEHVEELSSLEFEETHYGRADDKLSKNIDTVTNVPGVEMLPTGVMASSDGLTVDFYAPWGVICAITPVTNPSATIAGNGVSNLAAGNAVVFNAHPAAKVSTALALQYVNQAIVEEGGPCNMLTCCKIPTMETLDRIMKNEAIRVIIGTGGEAMVKNIMGSGKKVIAAGPGNPPCLVDETVDVVKAAKEIVGNCSFENNLMCVAEKEIFVVDEVYDAFMDAMEAAGCKRLTAEEAAICNEKCVTVSPEGKTSANKKFVGQNANWILEQLGIPCEGDPRLAFFEAQNEDNLVQTEQMMPIMPVVRVKDFEDGLQKAFAAEHNNHHSSSCWTLRTDRFTKFATLLNTTACVQCGGTLAAFGHNGTGLSAPTIATPTGEGPTGPWSFLRRRRVAFAGGLNYML